MYVAHAFEPPSKNSPTDAKLAIGNRLEQNINMAAALLALLAQGAPNIQTRKALVLTGLQNDFLSPEGKLPVSSASGFLDRLKELVPTFREYGDVVWVRSQFQETREVNNHDSVSDHVIAGAAAQDQEGEFKDKPDDSEGSPAPSKKARLSNKPTDRPVTTEDLIGRIESGHAGLTELQDEDEELFLSETTKKEPCCIPGSFGAEYATQIKDLVDPKDIEVIKTYYSAFGSTSLLLTLRSRLITELFICGCITNLSVFATAMDAARYGIKVTLVEDCLGYRRKDRHEQALKQLHEIMEADIRMSSDVIERLRNPPTSPDEEDADESEEYDEDEVAVGEDAEGIPTDLLEAGSTDEEEDAPLVRPSYTPIRPLPLRYAALTTQGLLDSATAGSGSASFERTEPPSARATNSSGNTNDGSHPTSTKSGTDGAYGKSQNTFERRFIGAAHSESVKTQAIDDESSSKIISRRPWMDEIREEWKNPSHSAIGRSTHPGLNAMSALVGLNQSTVNDMENM
jgi:nicotinamidase-related amidase